MAFFVDLYQLMFDETVELPNLDSTDGSQVEASAWSNEAQCPKVELFKVVGGGHATGQGLGATWTSAPAWWRGISSTEPATRGFH